MNRPDDCHVGGRRRKLTRDETELWRKVTSTIAPMRARARIDIGLIVEADAPAVKPAAKVSAPVPAPPPPAPKSPPMKTAPPVAARLDTRFNALLKRGRKDIDAILDLHGKRQDEAHRILRQFLHQARDRGDRLVLVVTGKGKGSAGADYMVGGGVLQRCVPQWLHAPDLRDIVMETGGAGRAHGGSGALYVRIRRIRDPEARWERDS